MSDKPVNIRNLPPLTAAQIADIDLEYQARLESLQAVDEGIERIINTLAENGELENTFIFFTSDNGYHLGQHRLRNGKGQPYEEDIRVPLLVRGPGVQEGASLNQFPLNIDFAPTIAELAHATPGRAVDGQSLAPLLVRDTPSPHNWRKDFLVEIYRAPGQPDFPGKALRTRHEMYVEYSDGFREFYDLRTDPYQLNNIFAVADKGHVKKLSARLAELVACGGESCRDGTGQASSASPAPMGSVPAGAEPVDQLPVSPSFARALEPSQLAFTFLSEPAGQSVWDDQQSILAAIGAALTDTPVAAL